MYFSGQVNTVIYEDPAQAFYILKMVLDNEQAEGELDLFLKSEFATVRGHVPGMAVQIGTWFGFEGEWTTHRKFGRQIAVSKAPVLRDGWDAETAQRMLAANGVGGRVLAQIRNIVGDDRFMGVLADETCLKDEVGLDSFMAMFVVQRWQATQTYFRTLTFLSDIGLQAGTVRQVWTHFGDDAEQVLGTDPWRLVEVDGITFPQADGIALRLGLHSNNPSRIRGAVLYACKSQRNFGHLFLLTGQVLADVKQFIPGVTQKAIAEALVDCHRDKYIVLDRETKPGTVAVYEPWSWEMEREGADFLQDRRKAAKFWRGGLDARPYIKALASVGPKTEKRTKVKRPSLKTVVRTSIGEWGESAHLDLSKDQQEGVQNALLEPVSILTGLPGTGKCVALNTLVSGPAGICPIGDFVPGALPKDAFTRCCAVVDSALGPKETVAIYNGGVTPTIRVQTSSGFELEGTPEHPIRVVHDGELIWKALGELGVGDVPVLIRGGMSFPEGEISLPLPVAGSAREWEYKTPPVMSATLARILGYLTSEGSTRSQAAVQISTHDRRVQEFLVEAFRRLFGVQAHVHKDKRVQKNGGRVGIRFNRTGVVRWFRQMGVKPELAESKSIPTTVLRADRGTLVAYLSALFEGDGSVDAGRCTVEYGTSSRQLAYQIHVLLLGLGIVATRLTVVAGGKPFHRLSIYGEDYDRFREVVGFHYTELPPRDCRSNTNRHLLYGLHGLIRQMMSEVSPKKGHGYNLFYRWSLPPTRVHHRKPSRRHLRRLLSFGGDSDTVDKLRFWLDPKWFCDPVASLERGEAPVADFTIPEGHEFVSGGFISHNTTSLQAVVRILQEANTSFLLCAPTGIAAKNLSNLTGAPAYTIHRAFAAKGVSDKKQEATYTGIVGGARASIGKIGEGEFWEYGLDNPHPAEVIVIDEASMLDQHLIYRLLTCTSPQCRMIIVGDAAQLPSVGPGNVLRGMIASGQFPVVNLTKIFRQKDTSDIVYAAHAIYRGEVPVCEPPSDFSLVQVSGEGQVLKVILRLAEKLYKQRRNFQILSPRHAGIVGVTNLNANLREILNPRRAGLREIRLKDDMLREDDRIMIVKNNYKFGVYNGDVGKISRIDSKAREVELKIFGAPPLFIRVPFQNVPKFVRMAYACTVHKVQGLEYDVIVMPLVDSFRHQLQRNLLYTAVTRAKKKVILVGAHTALTAAVINNKEDLRNTLFQERLVGGSV